VIWIFVHRGSRGFRFICAHHVSLHCRKVVLDKGVHFSGLMALFVYNYGLNSVYHASAASIGATSGMLAHEMIPKSLVLFVLFQISSIPFTFSQPTSYSTWNWKRFFVKRNNLLPRDGAKQSYYNPLDKGGSMLTVCIKPLCLAPAS